MKLEQLVESAKNYVDELLVESFLVRLDDLTPIKSKHPLLKTSKSAKGPFIQGNKVFYIDQAGRFHREDGPAIIDLDTGQLMFYNHGNIRQRDQGPGIIAPDGTEYYYTARIRAKTIPGRDAQNDIATGKVKLPTKADIEVVSETGKEASEAEKPKKKTTSSRRTTKKTTAKKTTAKKTTTKKTSTKKKSATQVSAENKTTS